MLNLGTPELLVILVVALVVLGPGKLPDAARSVGKAMGEMRRLSSGFKDEVDRAINETPVASAPTERGDPGRMTTEGPRPRRSAPLRADADVSDGSP